MNREKQMVYLAGMGMGTTDTCPVETLKLMETCDCIIGAKRLLQGVSDLNKPMYAAYQADEIKTYILAHQEYRTVMVMLSGDTGFYSGAGGLYEVLGDDCRVRILPGISSVVYFAAKLGVSWDDARLISIHGRECAYIHVLARNKKTFMLFGGTGCADAFCQAIKSYELNELGIWIGSRLGSDEEQIVFKTNKEITPADLDGLVILYIENSRWISSNGNLPDHEFIRGKVPMTKEEVRFISIAKLGLTDGAVLYDIGAGTGSIAVEAAARYEHLRVYAIERNPDAITLIEKNRRKFCVDQIRIIQGSAPVALDGLEAPTHVFIGGSSGNLKTIIARVKAANPEVRVVINAITLETLHEAVAAEQEDLLSELEIVQVGITKTRSVAGYHMLDGQNPVYIIAEKGAPRYGSENSESDGHTC